MEALCKLKGVWMVYVPIAVRSINPYSAGIDFSRQDLTSAYIVMAVDP